MFNQQSIQPSFNAVNDYVKTFLQNQACLSDKLNTCATVEYWTCNKNAGKPHARCITVIQTLSDLSETLDDGNPVVTEGFNVTVTSVRDPEWSYCLAQIVRWLWWHFTSLNTKYLGLGRNTACIGPYKLPCCLSDCMHTCSFSARFGHMMQNMTMCVNS